MTAITAVLLFAAWTLVLMFMYVGYRVALVLAMKKKANAWTRGDADADPPLWDPLESTCRHASLSIL